ncbi:hypothetical protein BDV26DRAFT_291218 [Aspergillus bertholletiae]|uniref:Involucrin repeat protein n=1 Tax=Aspergillus bertholletiae TaxID=1226010 RepID=A0A5N7BCI1_9EURO|nr:hypothetical protein BDV26DRAFT_291218 [Aspergillus bertholletiae]
MFKALLAGGRSSDARSSSSAKSSNRRRTDSKASSTASRKSSRGDDRDRGFGDLSTYSSSGNRSKRYAPSAAGESVASSYATAEPHSAIEPGRDIIERVPRRRDTNDSERRDRYIDSDNSDDKARPRRNRSRSRSRERTRGRYDNIDEGDNGNRDSGYHRERQRTQPTEMPISPGVPISGAGADLTAEVGISSHPQPPPPFHNTHPVTSMPSPPNVPGVYDPHVQQQFPGQFPAFVAEPYRPPNPAGEAADYYGDQGQSVAQQPGVRPKPPTVIPNSQAHLMPASPSANPPPEPSSMGQVGAAAAYYEDDADPEIQIPEQSSKPPSGPAPKPPRPTIQTEGASGPAATAIGHDEGNPQDIGSGSPPLLVGSTPTFVPPTGTNPSKPPNAHGVNTAVGAAAVGAAAGYMMGHHHQSSLNAEHSFQYGNQNYEEGPANVVEHTGPHTYPDQLNAPPYTAGVEEAAPYAAHPSHPHHAALYHGAPFQSGPLAFQQRQRGPLYKFLDFWRDTEGVGMFEDYTETIGVCKHCFEPGTSSRDAPRKHSYKPRRRSSDRYSNGSRVEKASRYSSSEDEGRRRKKTSTGSWLPGMLAGYTVKSLFNNRDFEDTYSVRSGRAVSSTSDNESLSMLEKQNHTSRGIYGRSRRRSYEDLRDYESRRLPRAGSHSRSRSSSRSEKHSALRNAALGAAIGTAAASVSQPRVQSQRKAKNRKSSSSESSFVDISRPAKKSVGGGLSSFFTASSENRRKRHAKKRRSIFSFNNSSSSSLDADLAFGSGYAKRSSGKSKKMSKKKDQEDVDAALLGLGATATAIAASTHYRSRRAGEILVRKVPTPARLGYSSNDDAWEDVDSGDQSSSSVNSALAFGGSGLYGSNASPSSDSGTSLWGWRWGNRKGKKQKSTRSKILESRSPEYNNQGRRTSEDTVGGAGSLQHVAPVPTSDPSRFDAVNISPFPQQPALIRPGPIPLQQPQPVTPVSQAVYTSQGETIHAYTTPSRPPPFANTFAHYDYHAQASRDGPGEHEAPLYPYHTDMPSKNTRPPRRSDSSPVFNTESLEGTSASSVKRRSTMKDQGSVQFDLTREQAEKERRADHLERLKRDYGHQGVQLIDRESEMAAQEDKHMLERYYEGHRDSDYGSQEQYGREPRRERGPASWVDLATAGAIGGTAVASVLSGQGSTGGFSESSQRRYYERSEKRRAERRRMPGSEMSTGFSMADRASDDVDQPPNPAPAQEHVKTSVSRDIPRKKPAYDDYAQFFAPKELRHSSDTYARREPAPRPTVIEMEPESQKIKATEEPHSECRDLPWPVPELKLIEPTPPQSQCGSAKDIASPISSPPEVSEDDRITKRSTTGSRVSWGKHETHEYEIPSTSSEIDSADHDITADRGREKRTDTVPTRKVPTIQADMSKGAASEYGTDIEFAATVAAATAAVGFNPALVSDIREKLVSPPGAHGYVDEVAVLNDGEKQPIVEKFVEDGPLYSEPVSMSDRVRTFHDDQPSSIAQEVIQQLTGKQASEDGELPGRAVDELNEVQRTLAFEDKHFGPDSPPEEALNIPGGFELVEPPSQQELCEDTQEPTQHDSRSIIPTATLSETPMEEASYRKDGHEPDTPSRAGPPAIEEDSTAGKKKRKKRSSKRASDAFDDSISVTSSPAGFEEASDRGKSADEQTKEKKTGGLLSNLFGSKVSEPVASRKSSSDSYPPREVQSEVGPRASGESRRQRREEKRRQKYGEIADLDKTTEREKDRTISQDGDDQPSFLAGSPEMPYQVGDGDHEGASGRFSSTDADLTGLGLDVFEQRSINRSTSPTVSGRAIDLSPKSQSRPSSPPLARGHEEGQQSRRSSGARPVESPTAVPLHFRRPPTTSPRAHRSPSVGSIAAPSPGSPTGRSRRPASGEFIYSREVRPLWLVEHHGSKTEVQPEEPLPSLPSSKTSSVNASAEDLASLQDERSWEKLELGPIIHRDQRSIDVDMPYNSQHEVLGSEEVTPTAADFGQMNTHQLPRKDMPKYEFHSPSELLQDPCTYAELPPSPPIAFLPSVEGSAVSIKDDGMLERNLDSLPPLPMSQPSTPENEQLHASGTIEEDLTREPIAPNVGAPRTSENNTPADADTSITKELDVDLPDLQPYDEKPLTKAMQGSIEPGDVLLSHESFPRDLPDEAVPVLPAVQLPTTEAVKKDREAPGHLATSPVDVAHVAIADTVLPTGEERALSAESLQAVVTDDANEGIIAVPNEKSQPQETHGMQPEPQNSEMGCDDPPGNANAKPEFNSDLISANILPIEGRETEVVDGIAMTGSAKPTTESTDNATDEAMQAPIEEIAVNATSPGSSKKKKKDKKKKNKSMDLHEQEPQNTAAMVGAAPSALEDIKKIAGATTQGEVSTEQISPLEGTKNPSEVGVEPIADLPKPDDSANVQVSVDMPVPEPEPAVNITQTEDKLAAEIELPAKVLKAGEEAGMQAIEGRPLSDGDPIVQAENPQDVVDLEISMDSPMQEPSLEISQPEDTYLAASTSTTAQKPNIEVLGTDIAQEPKVTTSPVQERSKTGDTPIAPEAISPEQTMPEVDGEALQENLESDKIQGSDAKPMSTEREVAVHTDSPVNNLESGEERGRVSENIDANESVKELIDGGVMTSSKTDPDVALQADEGPSKPTSDDHQSVKEALLPSEEEITSSPEHPESTMEGAKSLDFSGPDAVLPETLLKHADEPDEQGKEYQQPEPQDSTEHDASAHEGAPGVDCEPSTAVLEQTPETASISGVRGDHGPTTDLQEALTTETSIVDPAPGESELEPTRLENERTITPEETKAPMDPALEKVSSEKKSIPALVEPASCPEPAGEIAEASATCQDANNTDAQSETSVPQQGSNENVKESKRDAVMKPSVETKTDKVPPDVPSNERAMSQVDDEPIVPQNENLEETQPEEAPENANEGAIDVSPETTPGAPAGIPLESQDAPADASAEMAQESGSAKAPEEQPTKKGKKKKKNRRSISSGAQAVADAEIEPPLSPAEVLPVETPPAEISGVVHPTDDTQEATATSEITGTTEAVDAIPAAENDSNVPVESPAETNDATPHIFEHGTDDPVPDPELEAGESTPAGKKNKKNKKKKQSLQPASGAQVTASESASSTEVAGSNIDVPVATERSTTTEDQESVLGETAENVQPFDAAEPSEDKASSETVSAMTAAEKKKARKERKKQRKSALLDGPPAFDSAIDLNPENTSLEHNPGSVGEPALVQEPEAHNASTEGSTVVDELASEQPKIEVATDPEPGVALNEGLDEQSQEPAQQGPEETTTDIAVTATIEAENVELGQPQHHTLPNLAGTPANEEHSRADAEEERTVEIAGVEQEATNEKQVEAEPGDVTLDPAPTMNTDTSLEKLQEEALNENVVPEQTKDAGISFTDIITQDNLDQPQEETQSEKTSPEQVEDSVIPLTDPHGAIGEEAELPTPKKSKNKKKKKKQQSISLEDDPPAAVEDVATEEPQYSSSEKPTEQSEAMEHELTESPEQAEVTRPEEPELTTDTQGPVSKKKAKKDKKKRKSVSFATDEQEAPTKSSETTETTEAGHYFGETGQPPEQANEQMAEASALVQPSQENADSPTADEVQLGETAADQPKDIATVVHGEDDSELNKAGVPQDEQPYRDSITETANTLESADPDPVDQTHSVTREPVNEPTVLEPQGSTSDNTPVVESSEKQEIQQGTGVVALETSERQELESTSEPSAPETPSTSVQESAMAAQEAEQESVPSKSKKDKKKKKKRKTQESIENETPAVPEPSMEEAPVHTDEDNHTTAPEVIKEESELNNAAKHSESSSQDVPALMPGSIARQDETEQAVDDTIHEVKQSEGTEEQTREQPENPQNDDAPVMTAKERKKAKKKEKKRLSKIPDSSEPASTAAESASIVQEEKTQGPLTNAGTTSTEDLTHDATEIQVSAELNPSGPSVDTATPPAEDDGKENQSHGTESHGENDKNLFWTDHMVSSQVDQQQATPFDSPSKPVPENIEAEKVAVSGDPVTLSEEIEVGTEYNASTTEKKATSELDKPSFKNLLAEGFATEVGESDKALTSNGDGSMSQRGTAAQTTGEETMKRTIPTQTDEKFEEKDQEAAPEAKFVAEVPDTPVDDPPATDEEPVSLLPAEAAVSEDMQETNNDPTSVVEKLEAAAHWESLQQAQQPEDTQPDDIFSESNLNSTPSPQNVAREARDSELQVSSARLSPESGAKDDETASPRETILDEADLFSNPLIAERPDGSGAEVINASDSAKEISNDIQAEPRDLLLVSPGEENKEKETPDESDRVGEKPDGIEKRRTLTETIAGLHANIEPALEQLGHEELQDGANIGEGDRTTQSLNRKASKKQKKKAKKQANQTSIEIAAPSFAEPKREIDAESGSEATVRFTAMAGAAESSLTPEEKHIQSQEVQGPQSESSETKPAFEASSVAEEIIPPISREFPVQVTRELQEKEEKQAEAKTTWNSQTFEGDYLEAAEGPAGGHTPQQETPIPITVSTEEEGKSKQEAELQVPEQKEQPALGENVQSAERMFPTHDTKPEDSKPMAEATKAEDFLSKISSQETKQKSGESLGLEAKEPEETGSVSEETKVNPSQDQYHSEALVKERSAKDDEWPLIDWERERVNVLEQTPQSSPEAFAAPFEPDESAKAIKAKANMGPQGQVSEAKLATPEATTESVDHVANEVAPSTEEPDAEPVSEATREDTLDNAESSIPREQTVGEPGSVSQKQSKVASIFPNLERGAFRRPVLTKSSESVKDGAEDETNDQGASRGDAMQVSEAPIAATDGKDNDHIADALVAPEVSTTTVGGLPGEAMIHDIQMPVTSRSTQGNYENPEDTRYAQAETAKTDSLTRGIPLYAPTPIYEQPSALISSPEKVTKPNNNPLSSAIGMPSAVDRDAISPPRSPLQPIAEHEPIDRTMTPIGVMGPGHRTPRLEMKPEHVLPRPETPTRKFTDNALARQAWPTLGRGRDEDLDIRKRGSARTPEREWCTESIPTPERDVPILRPSSMGSMKSVRSTPSQRSLRRMDRSAGDDLRAASQAQTGTRQSSRSPQPPPVEPPLSDLIIENIASSSSYDPVTDKGKRPLRAMTDVYEGWGETPSSPRSPSRPPSIRHRRSMQHLQELETRLDQLISENRLLVAAREAAEDKLRNASVARRKSDHALNERAADLRDREAEVEQLRNSVEWLQKEVSRLTEENEGLTVTNSNITVAHATEIQTVRASSNRELDDLRLQNQQLSNEMQERVRQEIDAALAQKNMELRRLREDLESARDKVKELQQQIAASMQDSVLVFRDEDYFDAACQKLCGHVQQWVLRFSKHSDLRRCRKLDDIQDEKIADRFENAILDGSDTDIYLSDRVRRRDVFMSVVMTMVWEFIFTRYLFGMDREQRQKLKSLEKQLSEVGSRGAVHRWRATTLSLLSKRPAFSRQRQNDTEAVALEIFETLSRLLPPPSNVEAQLLESLRKVLRVAVNLSIEMRTQLAEYIMLPPLQPEYDTNGDLARQVYFNASLMNERSGETTSNEELETQQAVVRVVLFPLVVKKGNDTGEGEEEVVVCPAQVLVARSPKDKKVTRMLSGDRMSLDGTRSIHSIAPSSTMDMSNVI